MKGCLLKHMVVCEELILMLAFFKVFSFIIYANNQIGSRLTLGSL